MQESQEAFEFQADVVCYFANFVLLRDLWCQDNLYQVIHQTATSPLPALNQSTAFSQLPVVSSTGG
jgi:hypothetical protein